MTTFDKLYDFLGKGLRDFPWPIELVSPAGTSRIIGGEDVHWYGQPLRIHFKTESSIQNTRNLNGMAILEDFLRGESDMSGNLYVLTYLRRHFKLDLSFLQRLPSIIKNSLFQTVQRARLSVTSHYDIPQAVLDNYLDKRYLSYSCAMFENPAELSPGTLVATGIGKEDSFDSLEKAQWRKFQDAVEFVDPSAGDTILDVGCGYGGQLEVALENPQFSKVVGCTHSKNQVEVGRKNLARFTGRDWEMREADYREDVRVFNHITSTGMVSHVGPRGLAPYVREIRKRIRTGGRYVHHALMTPFSKTPLDAEVGAAFNKKYVWPGFHWFTLGEHIKTLEENGFEVQRSLNLSPNYAKTTAAWYERFMANSQEILSLINQQTFRAWQLYLAGASGSFHSKTSHVYRVYCTAV